MKNFFNKLFGFSEERNQDIDLINKDIPPEYRYNDDFKDLRKAQCPSCLGVLKKIPGAKTRCPHCFNYMYVKTNTKNIRDVVTEKDAEEIDKEWRIKLGTQEAYLENQKRFETRRESLSKKINIKEISDSDVSWSLLNEELLENIKKMDWGLYSNTKMNMADILKKEGRLEPALKMYLEVCYLDLNGSNNRGDTSPELLEEFPVFDPSIGFLAPAIIDYIKKISKKLNISSDDLKRLFIENNTKLEKTLNLPVSTDEAWSKIKKELENKG